MTNLKTTSIYHGWKNLVGSFVCAAVAISFTTYVFGVFTLPVTEEFQLSRATYNNGMIVFMAGMAIMSPIVGPLLDSYSARRLLMVGGVLFGLSLVTISRLQTLWLMLLVIALPLTFATGACGNLCANTVTVRWFKRRRGRALGILALSTSVGGFIIQPVCALLIESFGWRDALLILGVVALLLFLLIGKFILRDRPDRNDESFKEEFAQQSSPPIAAQQAAMTVEKTWAKGELLRSRNFWLLAICIGVMFGIDQAVLVSQVPYFQDLGYDLTTAAVLVSVKTISAIIGKLTIGYLADKIDLRFLFLYVAGSNALLMSIYILAPSFWLLVTAVALLGVAVGGILPVWTTMMAWLFGAGSYGTVMGFMSIIMQPFAMVTLRFIGQMYDQSGSYVPAFGVFIALALLTSALVWLLKPGEDREPVAGSIPGR